ncbi:MAG TPA: hypothetical protein VJR89_26200 [Polyangiales bacterium]|nr:hypothetical protein [Polyangiales bacterium]
MLASLLLAACAGGPTPPPAAASQPTAAEPVDLRGTWVEYWAVNGKAETDRYDFSEQGRFDWHAAAQTESRNPVEKQGTFRVERAGDAAVLVLEVERERFAGCSSGCPQSGPREVTHSTPIVERYELGECPVNPDAERVDRNYTCRAIGGKAFWRRAAGLEPEQSG